MTHFGKPTKTYFSDMKMYESGANSLINIINHLKRKIAFILCSGYFNLRESL